MVLARQDILVLLEAQPVQEVIQLVPLEVIASQVLLLKEHVLLVLTIQMKELKMLLDVEIANLDTIAMEMKLLLIKENALQDTIARSDLIGRK